MFVFVEMKDILIVMEIYGVELPGRLKFGQVALALVDGRYHHGGQLDELFFYGKSTLVKRTEDMDALFLADYYGHEVIDFSDVFSHEVRNG